MKQKTVKILTMIMIAIMTISIVIPVFADAPLTPGNVNVTVNGSTSSAIGDFGGQIIGTLQTIGSIIAVAILVILGIKYMMGSAEEKAEYKKTMIPYLVGALLIFAAVTIAGIVYNFANNMGQ